jgi:hypothetical protein
MPPLNNVRRSLKDIVKTRLKRGAGEYGLVIFVQVDSQAGFIPRGLPLLPNNVSGVMEL